jgi:hypothetical protein
MRRAFQDYEKPFLYKSEKEYNLYDVHPMPESLMSFLQDYGTLDRK